MARFSALDHSAGSGGLLRQLFQASRVRFLTTSGMKSHPFISSPFLLSSDGDPGPTRPLDDARQKTHS